MKNPPIIICNTRIILEDLLTQDELTDEDINLVIYSMEIHPISDLKEKIIKLRDKISSENIINEDLSNDNKINEDDVINKNISDEDKINEDVNDEDKINEDVSKENETVIKRLNNVIDNIDKNGASAIYK